MKKILNGFGWSMGILFILVGIFSIGDGGIFASLLGLWTIPLTRKKFREFYPNLKGWQSVIAGIVLFFVWAFALPAAETVPDEPLAEVVETEPVYTKEASTESIIETVDNTESMQIVEGMLVEETEEIVGLGEMKVHFLDVDQGLAIFVQVDDEVLLYDGGDSKTASYVVAYLKENNIEKIDYLISSHYDSDHVYGLIGCLNAFEVKNVIGSDYEHDSDTYQKFATAVKKKGLKIQHPDVKNEFALGEARNNQRT